MEDAQVLRSIGGLEEAVRNLSGLAIRMDDKSSEARRQVYEKIEAIKDEVDDLSTQVKFMRRDVDALKPKVEELDENHQRISGAIHAGKLFWTALASIVTLAGTVAYQVYQIFFHAAPIIAPIIGPHVPGH